MKIAVVVMLTAGLTAHAQEPVLKGPEVPTPAAKTSLVEHDFNGRLRPLEVPPEEAALKLLTLDDATRAKTDKVFVERAVVLDKAVIENLELIAQIHSAGQSGDKAEALKLLGEFAKKLEGLGARGRLVEEVKAALPEQAREQYAALVKEYHEAAIEDVMAQASSRREKLTIREAVGRITIQAIGKEIKRSYDRQITSKSADYEKLLATLGLRPDQEGRIRKAVTDYVQQTKGNPTAEQKRDMFWRIHRELDEEQRRILVRQFRNR